MKSKLTKILCLVMGAILLVTGTVAVTLAYLQDLSETVKNTMTVGKVDITLNETDVDVYGVKDSNTRVTENLYKMVPGSKYTKDPLITIDKDSEDCYVFFGLYIDESVKAVLDNTGTKGIVSQLTANGWHPLESGGAQVKYTEKINGKSITYLIYYQEDIVESNGTTAKTLNTFKEFTVSATSKPTTSSEGMIYAKAFAIQSDNITVASGKSAQLAAWEAGFKSSAG